MKQQQDFYTDFEEKKPKQKRKTKSSGRTFLDDLDDSYNQEYRIKNYGNKKDKRFV